MFFMNRTSVKSVQPWVARTSAVESVSHKSAYEKNIELCLFMFKSPSCRIELLWFCLLKSPGNWNYSNVLELSFHPSPSRIWFYIWVIISFDHSYNIIELSLRRNTFYLNFYLFSGLRNRYTALHPVYIS